MTIDPTTAIAERYLLGALLGRGGTADVHRATDLVLGRTVALKLLRGSADRWQRDRFALEAHALASLDHPALVTLWDADLEGATPHLALEYVDGPPLAACLDGAPLPGETVMLIGQQVADGLAHAHRAGVVHRDVKPGNILLDPDGRVKLVDLGNAWLSDGSPPPTGPGGRTYGTAAYVAPELVTEGGGPVSGAADVYSLGLVLLEMLTGRRAFVGPSAEIVRARPRVPASLGPEWQTLVTRMTTREPSKRPRAAEVSRMLGEPEAAVPDVCARRSRRRRTRGLRLR